MPSSLKISIITPLYNEEVGIEAFCICIQNLMNAHPEFEYEIICVDDGSTDGTLEKLIPIISKDSRFIALELSRNFGKEAALTAGLDIASGDAMIPLDADLQDPPELIFQMIEKWHQGAEVVLARRIDRSSDGYAKRKSAQLFYQLHNRLSSIQIPDNVGDFRLMDRSVVDAIKRLPEQQRFMKGLFAWVGYKTATIDYVRPARLLGKSKFSGWKLWNFALEGLTSFSAAPLRLWTYVGAAGAFITIIYAIYITTRTIFYGVEVPGYASLLVVTLFLGSLQLLSIGILGEYIGRIYMETKHRPLYIVRKLHGERQ